MTKPEKRKKGKSTDYVDRQYIGNLGKIDNGIVSVNTDGIADGIAFPLMFKIFKPQKQLQEGDVYKTKIQLALINYPTITDIWI